MTVRHVVIEQADGQTCIIPNSVVDSSVIVNMSNPDTVATFVEVEVDYATDIDKARKIIMEILKTEPLVVEAEKTSILVSALTANGMLLKFAVYTRDIMESYLACSNVRQRIVSEFDKAEILIPYNTVTIDAQDAIVQSTQMQMAMNEAQEQKAPPENPVEGFEKDHYLIKQEEKPEPEKETQ